MRKELGDFQTPPALVKAILECPDISNKIWSRAIEPTCGQGNFINGLLHIATPPVEIQAIEIQSTYLEQFKKTVSHTPSTHITVQQADIFRVNLRKDLLWVSKGPLVVIGNPPWVTNAELGALGSNNLPIKKNVKGLNGIAAQTGESNFDIAEYIWLKILQELAQEQPMIAMLCKLSVARNVLQYAASNLLPVEYASIRLIDAKKWFEAAVEACLLCVKVGQEVWNYEIPVYQDMVATQPKTIMGIVNNRLVSDISTYKQIATGDGTSPVLWRQGLKHDAASIMELNQDAQGNLFNKKGEQVQVEANYLYPLLKSTDLFQWTGNRLARMVIVPQKQLGEDTTALKYVAPKLWHYLTSHRDTFAQRKSSIYEKQPPFAIFGIGEYAFANYKVGISGLHKQPRFRAIGPISGRPVMLDDTCYFVPCHTPYDAALLASLLNDPVCLQLIHSIVFLDAKRPITKKLLQRIDLLSMLASVEKQRFIARVRETLKELGVETNEQQLNWSYIKQFLQESFQDLSNPHSRTDSLTLQQLVWI